MGRIIQTGITKEILSGDNHPQIQIGDKLYTVDDRKSTYDKINKLQKDDKKSSDDKEREMFVLALGKEATDEIYGYDLSVTDFNNVVYSVTAAIAGLDVEEIKREAEQKN